MQLHQEQSVPSPQRPLDGGRRDDGQREMVSHYAMNRPASIKIAEHGSIKKYPFLHHKYAEPEEAYIFKTVHLRHY